MLYCKGPYDALQTGWSLQVGVSQLSGSYPESLHQSINRSQSCNTCVHGMTLPFETAFVSEGACCHPGVVLTSSSSTPFGVWMLCKSGLLAMSSNSKTRLRVKSCVTKACYRRKKTTDSNWWNASSQVWKLGHRLASPYIQSGLLISIQIWNRLLTRMLWEWLNRWVIMGCDPQLQRKPSIPGPGLTATGRVKCRG